MLGDLVLTPLAHLLRAMDFREFSQEISKVRLIPTEIGDPIIGVMCLSAGVFSLWFRNAGPCGIDSFFDAFGIERIAGLRRIAMEAMAWIVGGTFILFGVVQLVAFFLDIPLFKG